MSHTSPFPTQRATITKRGACSDSSDNHTPGHKENIKGGASSDWRVKRRHTGAFIDLILILLPEPGPDPSIPQSVADLEKKGFENFIWRVHGLRHMEATCLLF